MTGIPKPEPRRRVKGRAARAEGKVVKAVRAAVVARDGYCRLGQLGRLGLAGPCGGASEWAHMGEHRRFRTRGKAPEERHTTAGSLMLCDRHHNAYDANEFSLEALTPRGADGRLRLRKGGAAHEEADGER